MQPFARFQSYGAQISDFQHFIARPGRHQQDFGIFRYRTVDHSDKNDYSSVIIVLTVKDQCFQRRFRITCRCRYPVYNSFQYLLDVDPRLCADLRRILSWNPYDLFDFVFYALGIRCRKIDFIDDRKDLQIVVQGQISIGERLRLHRQQAIC